MSSTTHLQVVRKRYTFDWNSIWCSIGCKEFISFTVCALMVNQFKRPRNGFHSHISNEMKTNAKARQVRIQIAYCQQSIRVTCDTQYSSTYINVGTLQSIRVVCSAFTFYREVSLTYSVQCSLYIVHCTFSAFTFTLIYLHTYCRLVSLVDRPSYYFDIIIFIFSVFISFFLFNFSFFVLLLYMYINR